MITALPDNLRRVFVPPERLSVSTWTKKHIRLPLKDSVGGPFRPYSFQVEILDAYGDPMVQGLVMAAGAQIGKSRMTEAMAAYTVCEDAADLIWVYQTEKDAKIAMRERIQALVEGSPRVSQELTNSAQDVRTDGISFRNCSIYMAWAGSASSLASKTCRIAILDEIGKYKGDLGDEGSPIALAAARTNSYGDRRTIVAVSSCTTHEHGIWPEYLKTDQRSYWVPCPHCGGHQVLEWPQVVYPENTTAEDLANEPESVQYLCAVCGEHWSDQEKRIAVDAGKWVPKACTIDDEGVIHGKTGTAFRGYHLVGLLTPQRSLADFAIRWKQSQGKRSELATFFRSDIGVPWSNVTEGTEDTVQANITNAYQIGGTPPEGTRLVAGVDCGKQAIHWVVRAFRPGTYESWLIDRGVVAELQQLDQALLGNTYGGQVIEQVGIDAGWKPERVKRFVHTRRGRCFGLKGRREHADGRLLKASAWTSGKRGTAQKGGLRLWSVATTPLKDIRYDEQSAERWHVPADAGEVYREHCTAEVKIEDDDGAEFWAPITEETPNHYGDADLYAFVAAEKLGIPRSRAAGSSAPAPSASPQGPRPRAGSGWRKRRAQSKRGRRGSWR